MDEIKYIVAVQCHIVKERCSGYFCEQTFRQRTGAFSIYDKESGIRFISMTCGGCCGRAVHRKLNHLINSLKKFEKIEKEYIAVHLASCICFDNYHAPPCPHIDYLKTLISDKLGLKIVNGTKISKLSEKRRCEHTYTQT